MARFFLIKIGEAIAALLPVTRGTGVVNPIPAHAAAPGDLVGACTFLASPRPRHRHDLLRRAMADG